MQDKKFAYQIVPGDRLESESGVVTVVRAHAMDNDVVAVIATVGGQLTPWAHYNRMDQFNMITAIH